MMDQTGNWKPASEIFHASLKAVDPYDAVKGYSEKIRSLYIGSNFKRLLVVGFGKAVCPMAGAIEDSLGDIVDEGVVITKYGHCSSPISSSGKAGDGGSLKIRTYEAGHPVPDENGVKGTDEIVTLLKSADEDTLCVCLISGGGSALLASPYEGITLAEKQETTNLLLRTGADINELNTVRKHISKVKGGRLAEIAYPSSIISLILSDVIGDRLDVIASGPTSPDHTTYDDALNVLKKYGLINKIPNGILDLLHKGADGSISDTPEKGDVIFERAENIIIGSSKIALDAAKQKAEALGFEAEIISCELSGEAQDAGRWLAQKAIHTRKSRGGLPLALISGGETTVTVRGNGLGGRNMELALAFALEIEGIEGITLLSAGTDGTDGPTDAAGAFVDGETVRKAKAAGIDPLGCLYNNDSYNFFKRTDGLLITGPTGTNVMDVQIILLQ